MSQAIAAFDAWATQYREWLCTPIATGDEMMQEMRFQIFIMSLGPVLQLLERESESAGIDSTPISRLRGSLNVISQEPGRFEVMLDDVWGIVQRLKAGPQKRSSDDEFTAPMSKGDIARRLGISTKTLAEWIKADPPRISVRDVEHKTMRIRKVDLPD